MKYAYCPENSVHGWFSPIVRTSRWYVYYQRKAACMALKRSSQWVPNLKPDLQKSSSILQYQSQYGVETMVQFLHMRFQFRAHGRIRNIRSGIAFSHMQSTQKSDLGVKKSQVEAERPLGHVHLILSADRCK